MKRAFQEEAEGSEIEIQFQEKFKECMAQLRSGFSELIQRRKEYKIAKQSKKSETKTNWKAIKEDHKNRIRQCKAKIAEARSDFRQLVESMKMDRSGNAVIA